MTTWPADWHPRVWHPVTLGLTLRKDRWDYVAWRLKFALRIPEGHVIAIDYRGLGPFRWLLLLPFIILRRRPRGLREWVAAARYAVDRMLHGWPPMEAEA